VLAPPERRALKRRARKRSLAVEIVKCAVVIFTPIQRSLFLNREFRGSPVYDLRTNPTTFPRQRGFMTERAGAKKVVIAKGASHDVMISDPTAVARDRSNESANRRDKSPFGGDGDSFRAAHRV
jgi:hypothetical protein